MKLLLSSLDQQKFERFALQPQQGLLLVAPNRSGKTTVLNELAACITKKQLGLVSVIEPEEDKKTIGIDSIRRLKQALKLKSKQPRAVIIHNAGLLTPEAQNSFLKILEEPPKNVHFLLGVNNDTAILETIKSRVVIWRLVPPTKKQITDYFSEYPMQKIDKAIEISQKRAGLIKELLTKGSSSEVLESIELAKTILASDRFKRLLLVDELYKDPVKTSSLLEGLEIVCQAALKKSADSGLSKTSKWAKRLKEVLDSQYKISNNLQARPVLTRLFLVL
ncbi:hypothetical protein KBB76_01600 [Candidatus Saccharibacteria bacterium]|jgi:DNA polymerase-3 subunit delta'|nr:hypothetical protein [Candidatus Saccharibacteria bacterium]HOR23481.1 hypothetical protein [Candidatus Saccharibacteria bacterium]HPW47924.1 hypothetical protein [Candidatus Saccharibacteria bacterium]